MGFVKNILYKVSCKRFLSLFKDQTIFPYYHLVRDNQVAHIEYLYPFKNTAQFSNDIALLKANYTPISPKELLDNKIPKNGFLLTFDDGLQEIYTVIYPILKQQNISAIFFINPDFVDNEQGLYKHFISVIISDLKNKNFEKDKLDQISRIFSISYDTVESFKKSLLGIKFSERDKVPEVLKLLEINPKAYLQDHKPYLTKSQIQEMIDDGFYFGGHTMTHPPLNQINHDQQKTEIIDSVNWVKENFNLDYSLFAFPFSDKSASKKLLEELFEYDNDLMIFGNAGIKKDINPRIIQRFSLEDPKKDTQKRIVTENLYKYFNKLVGKYHIQRK